MYVRAFDPFELDRSSIHSFIQHKSFQLFSLNGGFTIHHTPIHDRYPSMTFYFLPFSASQSHCNHNSGKYYANHKFPKIQKTKLKILWILRFNQNQITSNTFRFFGINKCFSLMLPLLLLVVVLYYIHANSTCLVVHSVWCSHWFVCEFMLKLL